MEVLALGLELPNHLLILDDRRARRYACDAKLDITGTIGILLLAKERGLIDAVLPIVCRLQKLQFRIDAKTLERIQYLAEESG